MIPQNLLNVEISPNTAVETTRTYRMLDKTIQGFTDGILALEQSIYKILNTEKYEYPIYSFSYGAEFENLIGKDKTYVQIELKRRIKDCLLKDERITNVDNFRFAMTGDEIVCVFDVQSIYGDITVRQEVSV